MRNMLTASPSPRPPPSPGHNKSPSNSSESARSRYDLIRKSSHNNSPISRPRSSHVYAVPQPTQTATQCPPHKTPDTSAPSSFTPHSTSRPKMVDVGTQYSPPPGYTSPSTSKKTPTSQVSQLNLTENSHHSAPPEPTAPVEPESEPADTQPQETRPQSQAKRHASESGSSTQQILQQSRPEQSQQEIEEQEQASAKRLRPEGPPTKMMPIQYEDCDPRELVILISSMLMELIRYNDAIPLRDGALTRFHSRAPPTISVIDYLQRLTTHATLSPPILLSMVYYIDKLCALYPAFTISSLTVHRFLITSATVASKGLSDSFWTNKTYARVGGVSVRELALLELEFLVRVQWRIVPKPEVLVDYYRSLVERSPGYVIEGSSETVMTDPPQPN